MDITSIADNGFIIKIEEASRSSPNPHSREIEEYLEKSAEKRALPSPSKEVEIPTIEVGIRRWAFTSSLHRVRLYTPPFGDNYVCVFTATKMKVDFIALAHIDQYTSTSSIRSIFARFTEHDVPIKSITVSIYGGLRDNIKSFKNYVDLAEALAKYPCQYNTENRWKKVSLPLSRSHNHADFVDRLIKQSMYGLTIDSHLGMAGIKVCEEINLVLFSRHMEIALEEELKYKKELSSGKFLFDLQEVE